ncbi:MAG TPA: hypothetical protein DIW43_19740, partial [Spongiibacteraceae bacterium]|nr:hypothetical protein [Spongiibacteraceae bacterium]
MQCLSKFRGDFKLDRKADLRPVSVSVETIYKSEEIASSFLLNKDPNDEADGFRIHSLLNLLSRVFEHAQAALSTGSPSSSETLGRTVVEGSIYLMWLATLGNPETLLMFFRGWINEHDRKLSEWTEKVAGLENSELIFQMIEARREAVSKLGEFIDGLSIQCGIGFPEKSFEWPKSVHKRFENLDRVTDYYTSYHGLSGSSHLTGEDTIRWLLSLNMPRDIQEKLGHEALSYLIMMSR